MNNLLIPTCSRCLACQCAIYIDDDCVLHWDCPTATRIDFTAPDTITDVGSSGARRTLWGVAYTLRVWTGAEYRDYTLVGEKLCCEPNACPGCVCRNFLGVNEELPRALINVSGVDGEPPFPLTFDCDAFNGDFVTTSRCNDVVYRELWHYPDEWFQGGTIEHTLHVQYPVFAPLTQGSENYWLVVTGIAFHHQFVRPSGGFQNYHNRFVAWFTWPSVTAEFPKYDDDDCFAQPNTETIRCFPCENVQPQTLSLYSLSRYSNLTDPAIPGTNANQQQWPDSCSFANVAVTAELVL